MNCLGVIVTLSTERRSVTIYGKVWWAGKLGFMMDFQTAEQNSEYSFFAFKHNETIVGGRLLPGGWRQVSFFWVPPAKDVKIQVGLVVERLPIFIR
jgi:hypothetical protein